MTPRFWQLALGYGFALAAGLALVYYSGIGLISGWFLPLGLFVLVGWIFSVAFVLYRWLSGNWPKR